MRLEKIYENEIINLVCDLDNCLLYFITFTGKVKVINFDNNFYTAQDDYDTYCAILGDMVDDNDISEKDYSDFVNDFSKWLKEQVKGTSDEDSIKFNKTRYTKKED